MNQRPNNDITWIVLMLGLIFFALFTTQARAEGQIVLSTEAGLSIMGPSGLASVGPLHRDEIATTKLYGVSLGYQTFAYGGRVRGLLGYELLNADGDWGVDADGDTARQIVDVQSSAVVVGVEYDFLQVKSGMFYPFVGAGIRLNINRPIHSALIDHADGSQAGCVADDPDTYSLGWHGNVGVGADFARGWTFRLFYQYTDRGSSDVDGRSNCPTWKGVDITPRSVRLTDHSIRGRLSYSF